MKKVIFAFFAYLFVALAIAGVFLPLLPTVPFLLLAAWCATKGSKRLHKWIYTHPTFGQLLRDWDSEGAVSRKSKITAIVMLVISYSIIVIFSDKLWLKIAMALLFSGVSLFLITRPEPKKKTDQTNAKSRGE